MVIRLEKTNKEKEEIVIKYHTMTPELKKVVAYLEEASFQLIGKREGRTVLLKRAEIYYLESVDHMLFAYTGSEIYQVALTLSEAETRLSAAGFFRCNKATIINTYKIRSLVSQVGNRIDAELDNGEHIIISRHYAKQFRELLKGGDSG